MFIFGESSSKFQMYNKQKANGVLTRKKSKCHNWNTRICRKSIQVWNFDLQSTRRGNWERLWGRDGRFYCTHISTPKLQNCENVGWLNRICSKVSVMWVKRGWSISELKRVLYRVSGVANDWFFGSRRGFYPPWH